ncbi:uncharacterized protein LOC128676581 [Plodia interpunctella]|uniref:uncharacterized protein LOC128676581 n=1 Tax=Plodia interpunctella TaxID=58824 RepID=UPI002368B0A3|nr:uncharacterized protein LOC128676581 [Plodia interpunctella]
MDVYSEEQLSDDEIFIGKLSLKEIKKRVLWNKQQDKFPQPADREMDRSLKIIETHSAPDILHKDSKISATSTKFKAYSNPVLSPLSAQSPSDNKASDDSFLQIEKMVTDLCVSTQENSSVVLDNTLDVIDYILKNGPTQNYENPNHEINNCKHSKEKLCSNTEIDCGVSKEMIPHTPIKAKDSDKENITPYSTPSKVDFKCNRTDNFATPCSNMNTPVFKTPHIPISTRKTPHSSVKKQMTKSNIYKNVASPVASYINNCPVVPLIKEVRPTKPLPGHSAIPKFVKSNQSKLSNKENVKLPTVAYKSAKKTEVIDIPDAEKLPQSQWAKKITSSLPRPLVMKHDHREMNIAKRIFMSKHEESFADLSLRQADVSVCTQKSAFCRPKKN